MTYIAHIRKSDGATQSLKSHLTGVSEIAEQFCSDIGLTGVGRYVGLYHDFGKYSDEYRMYVQGLSDASRGDIDHSTAGAQLVYLHSIVDSGIRGKFDKVADQMMALSIMSHHSGLIDCISMDGKCKFRERLEKDPSRTHFLEALANSDDEMVSLGPESYRLAKTSLSSMVEDIVTKSCDLGDRGLFRIGLLDRFILSCLIDADHIDSACFESSVPWVRPTVDWSKVISVFEKNLQRFDGTSEVSVWRQKISEGCRDASNRPKGVYTLSVPTGGGKTLSSLRYALNHAHLHGMKRIIYVIPYTSVIEQNAQSIRNILDDSENELVHEYHSNMDVGDGSSNEGLSWSYSSESWDQPIIMTTLVQFMDALFSSGVGTAKRMHNLSDAVLVFDEIQTIPPKLIHMFNEAVNFLVGWCESSVLLCTATQPCLHGVSEYPLRLSPNPELIASGKCPFKPTDRVQVEVKDGVYDPSGLSEMIRQLMDDYDNVLIITNTKSFAKNLHASLSGFIGSEIQAFHLSTNMCPRHRRDVLEDVKSRLGHERLVCVSTQLIEAGVDIDFQVVIRCMAGLDSIIQAAGRCNRHNLMNEKGKVIVVETNESLNKLPEIALSQRMVQSTIHLFRNTMLEEDAIEHYFRNLYKSSESKMSYPTSRKEATLYGMLSTNTSSRALCSKLGVNTRDVLLPQAFHEANSLFSVIDNTGCIIVPYDEESRHLVVELGRSSSINQRKSLLRRVQKYTVNTFQLQKMVLDGHVYEIPESGIYVLREEYYNPIYGLSTDMNLKTIIF